MRITSYFCPTNRYGKFMGRPMNPNKKPSNSLAIKKATHKSKSISTHSGLPLKHR